MKVKSIRKGRTMKVVTVTGVVSVNDTEVAEFAMAEAGETSGDLFGTNVTYFPEYDETTDEELETMTAVVDLYTD